MSERRLTIYLIGLGFLFLLLALAAFLGRSYLEGSVDKKAWTDHNELVLLSLPLYPGAVEVGVPSSTGEHDPSATTTAKNGGPFIGYWTTYTYTLPPGTGSDLVLAYYRANLVGWSAETVTASNCEIAFRRNRAKLDLKACSDKLELSLNYREYK